MDTVMIPAILQELKNSLIRDYGFKERKAWLQEGQCPVCSKRELFANADSPWSIRCGRENKCGWVGLSKELYPDIFEGFNKRYKPTEKNPNATADAYLMYQRGFNISRIKGWYEQGNFWHANADKGTATVRFWLDEGRTIHMERFVEEVTLTEESGEKKKRRAHFYGSHGGLWWQPPTLNINHGDIVYLVEGILDAIALTLNGIKAVSTLSCSNYPATSLAAHKDKKVTWIWALDNDKAGRKYIKKHVRQMRAEGWQIGAALIPQGKSKTDWNDLHQQRKITEKYLDESRYEGSLLLAQSATKKALLMYQHTERKTFHFDYKRRTYWFELDMKRFQKAVEQLGDADTGLTDEKVREQALQESGTIYEIANCQTQFLYFQANKVTDESWYYCRVSFPHDKPPVKNTFTGGQISSSSEFKKRLLGIGAGAMFTGTQPQLDRIIREDAYNLRIVQTVDFIGYSKEHGCYIFNETAVKNGQVNLINDEDFFELGKLSIKSLNQSTTLHVAPDRDEYNTEWVELIYHCFGAKGIVALAFWFGSLFAEQVREIHKSFPFLEVIGEAGAGKSTLIEFLWKLVGRRDYEGFDPSKSTLAARARNFAQVSNLPISLIEADRDEDGGKRFDWDELKTAYNGRSVRSRGMRTSGNETYEPPFRATIVISQNAPVAASEAVLQRIVHLRFTKESHTERTKLMAETLERAPMEQVSHFLLDSVMHEHQVMKTIRDKTPVWEKALLAVPDIKSVRIAKNHAQLMAMVQALATVVPLSDDVIQEAHDCLVDLAISRQQAINADHPIVQDFWEIFDYLNGGEDEAPRLDHSINSDVIAVNLNHFVQRATEHRQQIPPLIELKRHLKNSKARKYIDQRAVGSNIWVRDYDQKSKTVKCWTFQRER